MTRLAQPATAVGDKQQGSAGSTLRGQGPDLEIRFEAMLVGEPRAFTTDQSSSEFSLNTSPNLGNINTLKLSETL